MSASSPIKDRITSKLTQQFSPQHLEVIDESADHIGHAGHDGRGESHFSLLIVADSFAEKSRIERHRMVYATLGQELTDRIHALRIKAVSVSEYRKLTNMR
jgi:BolA protein